MAALWTKAIEQLASWTTFRELLLATVQAMGKILLGGVLLCCWFECLTASPIVSPLPLWLRLAYRLLLEIVRANNNRKPFPAGTRTAVTLVGLHRN